MAARAALRSVKCYPRLLEAFALYAVPSQSLVGMQDDGDSTDWSLEMPLEDGGAGGWLAFCRGLKIVMVDDTKARNIFRAVNKRRDNELQESMVKRIGALVMVKKKEDEQTRRLRITVCPHL